MRIIKTFEELSRKELNKLRSERELKKHIEKNKTDKLDFDLVKQDVSDIFIHLAESLDYRVLVDFYGMHGSFFRVKIEKPVDKDTNFGGSDSVRIFSYDDIISYEKKLFNYTNSVNFKFDDVIIRYTTNDRDIYDNREFLDKAYTINFTNLDEFHTSVKNKKLTRVEYSFKTKN